MTGPRLFSRRVRLLISSRRTAVASNGTVTPADLTDALELEGGLLGDNTFGFRIAFEYKRTWHWVPNNGNIRIWNLAPDQRALCSKDRQLSVVLLAGYGDDVQQVFVMSIKQANTAQDGTTGDWVTKLEGADGANVFANARANFSLSKGSKVAAAGEKLIKIVDAGLQAGARLAGRDPRKAPQLGSALGQFQGAAGAQDFKAGYTAYGSAVDELRDLSAQLGLDMSIQDERVHLVKRNESTGEIFEWSPETGLIGSPEPSAPPRPGKPPQLRCRGLLFPSITVRSKLKISSSQHDGEGIVYDLDHSGDTHGGDWYTTVNLRSLPGFASGGVRAPMQAAA